MAMEAAREYSKGDSHINSSSNSGMTAAAMAPAMANVEVMGEGGGDA